MVALASGAFLYASHPARGSDHQDSPAMVAQPGADITDVYVFPSPVNPSKVVFVMDLHPLIPAGMSGNVTLDPTVLYQFKFSHGKLGSTAPADGEFQFLAQGTSPNQKITVFSKLGQPLRGPSTLGQQIGSFRLNAPGTRLGDGILAYAGPRADPFFFDLFQFFTILPDRNYSNPRTGNMLGSSTPTFNGYSPGSNSGPGAGRPPRPTRSPKSTAALTSFRSYSKFRGRCWWARINRRSSTSGPRRAPKPNASATARRHTIRSSCCRGQPSRNSLKCSPTMPRPTSASRTTIRISSSRSVIS